MRISVVREIKPQEARVGLTPAGVLELTRRGHTVAVEAGAGEGAGFGDGEYLDAGARLVSQAEAWESAELLVKVKEPIEPEYRYLRDDLTVFTYLHLAADRPLTEALLRAGTLAIAYETVQDHTGLPLLTPMSEVAGRLAAHAAAAQLTADEGGPGLLLGGVPGVAPCRVLVIGGGVVGTQTARIALGMQAEVTVLDMSPTRIRQLDELFGGNVRVLMSDAATVGDELASADVVVGAVLVPGRAAPKVVTRDQLSLLKSSALLIDVAIDQGGAFETSRPTTYADPTFEVDGIRHYCVANMPGGVPRTSTRALTNATLPYVLRLAGGVKDALDNDPALALGVNTRDGRIIVDGVAAAFPDLPAAHPVSVK
ncbi:MAG: alanine dehydrogenase [Mycobacteriaceae bacterium]|uniref:alanine dehydrogenase n=1 Tax=Corynebacterium sp. TaxID=1720 RepID=UPI003F9DE2EA